MGTWRAHEGRSQYVRCTPPTHSDPLQGSTGPAPLVGFAPRAAGTLAAGYTPYYHPVYPPGYTPPNPVPCHAHDPHRTTRRYRGPEEHAHMTVSGGR